MHAHLAIVCLGSQLLEQDSLERMASLPRGVDYMSVCTLQGRLVARSEIPGL